LITFLVIEQLSQTSTTNVANAYYKVKLLNYLNGNGRNK